MIYDKNKNSNFEAYLVDCINNSFKTFLTKINRKKRIPKRRMKNYYGDDNESLSPIVENVDSGFDIMKEIPCLRDNGLETFRSKLSRKQNMVVDLIIMGYGKNEIIQILGISPRRYDIYIGSMCNLENRILLSGNSDNNN